MKDLNLYPLPPAAGIRHRYRTSGTMIPVVGRLVAAVLAVWLLSCADDGLAQESQEGIITGAYGNEFTLSYFNHEDETLEYLYSRGLQAGGYTWAGLVQAGLELERSPLPRDIYFDPEGDALFLVAQNRQAIQAVTGIIARLSKDLAYRERCIDHARSRGYLE